MHLFSSFRYIDTEESNPVLGLIWISYLRITYSQVRNKDAVLEIGDINVTIAGSRIRCSRNLFVTDVLIAEWETWLGRWRDFFDTTENDRNETCLYRFSSARPTNKIQALRKSSLVWLFLLGWHINCITTSTGKHNDLCNNTIFFMLCILDSHFQWVKRFYYA